MDDDAVNSLKTGDRDAVIVCKQGYGELGNGDGDIGVHVDTLETKDRDNMDSLEIKDRDDMDSLVKKDRDDMDSLETKDRDRGYCFKTGIEMPLIFLKLRINMLWMPLIV